MAHLSIMPLFLRRVSGSVNSFSHINRVKTKLLTERINHKKGYGGIVICTAKEVLEDEQDNEE